MFWCIGLLSVAFGLIFVWDQYHYTIPATNLLLFLLPPCLGAGLGALTRQKRAGLFWGLLASAVFLFLCFLFPGVPEARE